MMTDETDEIQNKTKTERKNEQKKPNKTDKTKNRHGEQALSTE